MSAALPPATLEGWYALHQMFRVDRPAWHAQSAAARLGAVRELMSYFDEIAGSVDEESGWSAPFRVVGGGADLMLVHFRTGMDEISRAELQLRRLRVADFLQLEYDYLSVTEAGLYHATAQAAAEHGAGTESFQRALAEQAEAEAASAHVRTRLYPRIPEGMRYASFYPMSKRRAGADNWYALPIDERNRLMREHGMTGRRFAGRVFQVITGSIGLDDWEWGVTLFARDPLEFKRIVTEMRYDEASARYGEFGRFFTGIRLEPAEWPLLLATE